MEFLVCEIAKLFPKPSTVTFVFCAKHKATGKSVSAHHEDVFLITRVDYVKQNIHVDAMVAENIDVVVIMIQVIYKVPYTVSHNQCCCLVLRGVRVYSCDVIVLL